MGGNNSGSTSTWLPTAVSTTLATAAAQVHLRGEWSAGRSFAVHEHYPVLLIELQHSDPEPLDDQQNRSVHPSHLSLINLVLCDHHHQQPLLPFLWCTLCCNQAERMGCLQGSALDYTTLGTLNCFIYQPSLCRLTLRYCHGERGGNVASGQSATSHEGYHGGGDWKGTTEGSPHQNGTDVHITRKLMGRWKYCNFVCVRNAIATLALWGISACVYVGG